VRSSTDITNIKCGLQVEILIQIRYKKNIVLHTTAEFIHITRQLVCKNAVQREDSADCRGEVLLILLLLSSSLLNSKWF